MVEQKAVGHKAKHVVTGWKSFGQWYRFIVNPIDFLEAGRVEFGPLFAIRNPFPIFPVGRQYVVAIGSKYNYEILTRPDRFRNTSFTWRGSAKSAQRQIHYGLTRLNGEKHRSHRQLLKPPFAKPSLEKNFDTIAGIFDVTLENWKEGQTINLWSEMRTASVTIATELLFGSEHYASGTKLDDLLLKWVDLTQDLSTFLPPLDLPGTKYAQLMRTAEQIKTTFEAMLDERRQSGDLGSDLLGVLLHEVDRPGSDMTETDLYSHAMTMFAASFENIANTVAWGMMLLAQHPQVLAELYEELDSELAGSIPTLDQLEKLPFLDAVLKETMRILPSAPFLIRACTWAVDLDGISIRPGDHIFLSTFHTHRDPELYPRPDRFDPWRWSSLQPGPYEYLPFGAGSRICIAKSFAWSQIKLMLSMLVSRWRLQMVENTRVDYRARIILRPYPGISMTVNRHNGKYESAPIHGQICDIVDFPSDDILPFRTAQAPIKRRYARAA